MDSLDIRELLRDEGAAEHERIKTALWDHMVKLENNVSVLEDLRGFPGTRMLGASGRVFNWMNQNLYEYTILIVWRLWDDTDSKSITLKRLRKVLHDYVRDEHRSALYKRFRALRPSSTVRDIFFRARAIRHGRIAHIDERYQSHETARVAGITVKDLRVATDFLAEYFNKVQFGIHSHFGLASLERRPEGGSNTQRLLEQVVLDTIWCRQYDNRGPDAWWRAFGSRLSEDEVQWLSDLRVRSGLTAIEPKP